MDKPIFYQALRSSKDIFGPALSTRQVDGMEALIDTGMELGLPTHHMANVLANVYRETGGGMYPIKETVYPSHKDQNPSDATVIKRLDNAYAKGQLTWVKTPYWRDGAFGRGQIQITHWGNYKKLGDMIGVDLRGNPSLALKPNISAAIAIVGMSTGAFTGKKLSDYKFPEDLDNPVESNPRRIVNGKDGSDAEVAKSHRAFYNALVASGYGQEAPPAPTPAPVQPPAVERTRTAILAEIQVLLDELKNLGD